MRFTIRFLLLAAFIAGIYCCLIFSVPTIVGVIGLMLLTVALPSVVVGGIIYSRGAARAYWIGCASSGMIPILYCVYLEFGIFAALIETGGQLGFYGPTIPLGIAICHAVVLASGFIVVLMRRLHSYGHRSSHATGQYYSILQNRVSIQENLENDAPVKGLEF